MFIRTNLFKKLLKEAYKGSGIRIGHENDKFYINGGYWGILVHEERFPKKEKAAVVELIGDLPENEFFQINKDEKQMLLPDRDWMELFRQEPLGYLEETKILVQEQLGVRSRLFRENGEFIPLNQALYDMIDDSMKTNEDSDVIGPYRVDGSASALFWKNNTSIVMFVQRSWKHDEELMDLKNALGGLLDGGLI